MGTNRLEAFSDGVIAVIITIMVLELKVPRDTTLTSLRSIAPQFLSYLLSFLVVAIMWVNHHHMLHSARRADARLLWSNNLFSSGCRWFRLSPPTWATIFAIRAPSRSTESCCRSARCRSLCCARPSFSTIATILT